MKNIYQKRNRLLSRTTALVLCTLMLAALLPAQALAAYADSEYKHINHEGAPYNIDAITGATLTVEGPGVEMSVPMTVRELQETADGNIYRGLYTDDRGARSYEGVRLLALLNGSINENVSRLNDDVEIVFKNRWRQDVGRLTYGQIKAADKSWSPFILAYGVADTKETNIRPFVFNGATGENTALGNGDGPAKLVYNMGMVDGLPEDGFFSSIAYMYIEEGQGRPGFKHATANDPAYNNAANTQYLLTFTGDALGREVNLTLAELQEMVLYDVSANRPSSGGLGHRDEYSLSNTTYWFVNEYEGVKLWDLLLMMGVPADKASDDKTLVSFASWDNYRISTQFSFKQLANPDLFYFYEKSPLDIGTDRPTKAQLALVEYQPGNQGTGWTKDANGYPVKKGYPVLLAYGLNGYPYVKDSSLPGYKTGLGNDGGPFRLIYGKTDGLNRSNPNALENYAYFFNNGSQQLQRVQEIYAGNEVRYSTHTENPAPAYQSMKDQHALTVDIVSAGVTTSYAFTLAELEEIVYGVEKRVRDGEGRQEKGYYFDQATGSAKSSNLFEGVSLEYMLAEHIGLQGTLGTIEMYSGNGAAPVAKYDLASVGNRGFNSVNGGDGLGMMIAFAKNGYPLVAGSSSPGFVANDPYIRINGDKPIKNSGGPLMFVRGQTAAERDAGRIETTADNKTSVENLTKIVINLVPDDFAHVGAEHAKLAAFEVNFSGAVARESGVRLTVGALETMQKYLVTDTYSVDNAGNVSGAKTVYRGLDLLRLLYDKSIGASGLTSQVTIKGDGGQITLTLAQLTGAAEAGKPVILAYGSATGGASGGGSGGASGGSSGGASGYTGATPLGLPYGPMRLIIDGATAGQCITNIREIEVIASSPGNWKHSSGVYAAHSGYTISISGQNLARNKKYTAAQIEDMSNIFVFDTYAIGSSNYWFQGVDLYKLLGNIGFAGDLKTSEITVTASDGYSIQFTGSQLMGGVNGKPLIIAFGQGTTQENGLPLVRDSSEPGFSPVALNDGGPLRLLVNDNSGWSVKYLSSITVGAAGGIDEEEEDSGEEEQEGYVFTVYRGGLDGGFPEAGVRSFSSDKNGGLWVGTYGGGAAYLAKGATSFTVYGPGSQPALKSPFTSGVAVDSKGGVWFSQNSSYTDLSLNHGAGYMAADGTVTYYNTSIPGTIPDDYVQAIEIDRSGNVWFGSAGGLTRFDGTTWKTWTKADGLPAVSVNTIVFDDIGGVWVGCYPDTVGKVEAPGFGTVDAFAGGYAYLNAGGVVTFSKVYDYREDPELSPWLMADYWTRGITVDADGGAWIVRSSSYMPHVGGRVDYVSADKSRVISWTGHELLGKTALTGTQEIRDIAADKDGGLWIGTSGAGLFHCSSAGIVHKVYNVASGAWTAETPMDNIYVVEFAGDTLYVGSAGGVAIAETGGASGAVRPDTGFAPVKAETAEKIISELVAAGGSVTRARFLKVLADIAGVNYAANTGAPVFSDVSDGIYAGCINWAARSGIVNGYPDGSFKPDRLITREEMAVLLGRFIRAGHLIPLKLFETNDFRDQEQISPYAASAVYALQRYGILPVDVMGGVFEPKLAADRACVADVMRAFVRAFAV